MGNIYQRPGAGFDPSLTSKAWWRTINDTSFFFDFASVLEDNYLQLREELQQVMEKYFCLFINLSISYK